MRLDIIDVTCYKRSPKETLEAAVANGIDTLVVTSFVTADPSFDYITVAKTENIPIQVVPSCILTTQGKMNVLIFGAVDQIVVPNGAPLVSIVEHVQKGKGATALWSNFVEEQGWQLIDASIVLRFNDMVTQPKRFPVSLSISDAKSPSSFGFAYTTCDGKFTNYNEIVKTMRRTPERFTPILDERQLCESFI